MKTSICLLWVFFLLASCQSDPDYDIILRNGWIYDGSGAEPYQADLAINSDTIAAIGDLKNTKAEKEYDVTGLAVTPGFINMLSWANTSLIEDGRSQSDIRQGVTLEVLGEGHSMGPLNDAMKKEMIEEQQDIKYDITWNTLGEYLNFLEKKGISTNVTSFVGNGSLRQYVMGYEDRNPTEKEMNTMKELLRQAMEEGAVGMSSALIYYPSGHASTGEIIELAKIVAEYDGMYVSHIRNEEGGLISAVNEFLEVAEKADIRSEIYHFKASGKENWHLLDSAITFIEDAKRNGLSVTTDMYMYNASSTGLNIGLPEWAKSDGIENTIKLLRDPDTRNRMIDEISFHVSPEDILLVGFKNEELRKYLGKTLAEVSEERNTSPGETVVDLILEDDSRIQVVYFSMSEDNIEKKIALPYMAFCSDAGSYATEGIFLKQSTHPRAYGSFARLLGKYVRDENVIPLREAIRRLTSFPAQNLRLHKRGLLVQGNFADVVVFDPELIQDNATFKEPHQYASGVIHVFVNGIQVLKNGDHTGQTPGRFVKGPGAR